MITFCTLIREVAITMGLYLRGPHLGPIHTGVRVRSRRGRGDSKVGSVLVSVIMFCAVVAGAVVYWKITVPIVAAIVVLCIWRYKSQTAKAARAAVTARGNLEKACRETNAQPAHVRAHVRATAPCLEELAAIGCH